MGLKAFHHRYVRPGGGVRGRFEIAAHYPFRLYAGVGQLHCVSAIAFVDAINCCHQCAGFFRLLCSIEIQLFIFSGAQIQQADATFLVAHARPVYFYQGFGTSLGNLAGVIGETGQFHKAVSIKTLLILKAFQINPQIGSESVLLAHLLAGAGSV